MTAESSPSTTEEKKKTGPRFIIGVRLFGAEKTEYFNPGNLSLRVGNYVMLETKRGDKIGVIASNKIVNLREDLPENLPRVLRIATPNEMEALRKREEIENKAVIFCLEKIAQLKLPMNLSRAVYVPEAKRTLFYFTAEGRVDFRELVKELAQGLMTKIEMRQVGVRDEAKAITGYGVCGESFCCSTFLHEFFPVTVRMAKDQGLALNPSKISGVCGRLMCCLQYEHEVYRDLIKTLPKVNSRVETPSGPGKTIKNDILQQKVTVRLDDESFMTYQVSELTILKSQEKPPTPPPSNNKKGKR